MADRRDKITIPESPICPNCSSPEQHSNFCTHCGAEITPEPDSTSVNPIVLIIGGLLALLLGLLTIFAMVGFLVFPLIQDDTGGWVWQRQPTAEEGWNDTYQECKDRSSSASLMFFNINTDEDKMRECLEAEASGNGRSDASIIAFRIPTEFKKILLHANGSNYTDALKEIAKTFGGAPVIAPELYRACLRDTSLLGWGPFHGFINKEKARECFIERHEDKFDGLSVSYIRVMRFPGWRDTQNEDVRDILMYINRPESEKILEKKKEELLQAANKEKPTKKCSINLQSYPAELEVTDFTDSNYGGGYQLDGTYNCSPKWTNFTCGKHGDGADITCYLFFSPQKAGTKSGTWVVQPLPPSDEWNAGAYYRCPGMPWESCSPGWIGGKSVTIKK